VTHDLLSFLGVGKLLMGTSILFLHKVQDLGNEGDGRPRRAAPTRACAQERLDEAKVREKKRRLT